MINAHQKGKDFERWIRSELSKRFDKYGGKGRRTIRSGAVGSYIQSQEGDVYHEAIPYMIEAKRTETIKLYAFWEQAVTECKNLDKSPVLVVKSNDKPALAVMDFFTFMDLVDFALSSNLLTTGTKFMSKTDQTKKTKLSVAETANLPFSKASQLERSRKKKS
jgi:hypothetical protein